MGDDGCVRFLQTTLPELGLRWAGFRRVRRQVCRRIRRRFGELGLDGWEAYRRFLAGHPEERPVLDSLCRVTISRFHRDRRLWEVLAREVLPELATALANRELAVWSAGCASGEEPYTLAVLWRRRLAGRFPGVHLTVLATDSDPHLLCRARCARYPRSSLREMPPEWIEEAFEEVETGELELRPVFRQGVTWRCEDLRRCVPEGPFHLVLCRNLVFTYFAEEVQRRVLEGIRQVLAPGGFLVLGGHEGLPEGTEGFSPWPGERRVLRKR